MERHPFARLFTVREANALIPKLSELLAEVARRRDELRRKAPQVEPALRASLFNGGGAPASEYGVEAYRLYLAVDVIRSLGLVLRDLDTGLLDFPHERDGRVVFLCWQPPEAEITHWHEPDEGFAGRKPL
ncbi:DUF2203 domain-containing protein [Rubrobacter indicoceani]|uniref:DUF2203 domain-containing protein n=1 Tax=Rubrobacter indicoceani TaxID=2051957 RepID=UPI000E5B841E|nr:DUF2203 domain-containing protein [Rubrobacter indicoceani]